MNKPTSPVVPATTRDLIFRAQKLFPRTAYLDAQAVRGARRGWIRSILRLRAAGLIGASEYVRRAA